MANCSLFRYAGTCLTAGLLFLIPGRHLAGAPARSGGTAVSIAAEQTTKPAEQVLEFTLRSAKEIPADLAPRLAPAFDSDAVMLLHQMVEQNNEPSRPEVTSGIVLRRKDGNVFAAPAAKGKYYLLIAHPGFLRSYAAGPFDASEGRRRFTVEIPAPGGIRATLIEPPEAGSAEQDTYCVTASLSSTVIGNFGLSSMDYHHPLRDWRLEALDLAPGRYRLHGTGRWCEYGGGPAGYAGAAEITVHPGQVAELEFDMSRSRHEYYKAEKSGELPQIIE